MEERNAAGPIAQSKRSRVSAGLLVFRYPDTAMEFLLVHPGGPFFGTKDFGVWTIPKGEAARGEDLLTRAKLEFEEEIGCAAPAGNYIALGSIKQRGGKTVHGWAIAGDLPTAHVIRSNTFSLEWPPRSGKFATFPEIDRAEFWPEKIAREKINPAQLPFIDRLQAVLASTRETGKER